MNTNFFFLHKLFEHPQGSCTSRQNARDISLLRNPRKTNFQGRERTKSCRPRHFAWKTPRPTQQSLDTAISFLWSVFLPDENPKHLLEAPFVSQEAQQRYFSYRAILVAIVSQKVFVLVSMGYRTIIARYVAKWGIAQMCLCETKCQGGGIAPFWGSANLP